MFCILFGLFEFVVEMGQKTVYCDCVGFCDLLVCGFGFGGKAISMELGVFGGNADSSWFSIVFIALITLYYF